MVSNDYSANRDMYKRNKRNHLLMFMIEFTLSIGMGYFAAEHARKVGAYDLAEKVMNEVIAAEKSTP